MTLTRNFSTVADSTLASSPPSLASSPVPIKRTVRTYGRRRDELDSLHSEQGSRDNILLTGPQNLSDEIPPSEPSGSVDSDEGGTDRDVSSSFFRQPSTGFGWREKMREIDGIDDLSSYVLTRDTSERASAFPSTTSTVMDTHPDFPCKVEMSSDAPPGNISHDSPSSLTTILQPTSGDLPSRVSYSGVLSNRLRNQKNMSISDDVLQDEDKRPICPSSPQSPSPHPLTTPISRRTSSPPTSHHDAISAPSSTSKQMTVPLSSGEEHMHSFEDAVQSYGKLGPRETKRRIKVKLFLYRFHRWILKMQHSH